MKKIVYLFVIIIICSFLCGCSVNKVQDETRENMDFTVIPRDEIPDELKSFIEEKKNEEFSMSYVIGESLYIVKGYGTVSTGGYSIRVDSLMQTTDEIFFHTTLIGPKASEPVNKMQTSPYIVVKIEYIDKKIIFE